MSVNSRLKAMIRQRKAFNRQIISDSSCARKETVDIDILVTSRNGDRKIIQSIRITSRTPSTVREWKQMRVQGLKRGSSEAPTVLHSGFCSLSNKPK